MSYEIELEGGQHLEIEQEGNQTFISFSHRGDSQQQSQGHGFATGAWSGEPVIYRLDQEIIVQLNTHDGSRYLRVEGNRTTQLDREPDLAKAEKLELKKSTEARRMRPMKPMEPMRPMEPMKPMEPMRPMEMKMGRMSVSMGGAEEPAPQKYCTKCGNPVREDDRFCGSCGHKV